MKITYNREGTLFCHYQKWRLFKEMISWWRTTFGDEEIANISNSIKNENISQGSVTDEFESSIAKALNVPYAVATTSGSMALLMALMAKSSLTPPAKSYNTTLKNRRTTANMKKGY